MPLLILRPRLKAKALTALEIQVLEIVTTYGGSTILDFPAVASPPDTIFPDTIDRDDARRALSALWRRGLLTRVGWGDTAVYRRRP